MPFQPHNRHGKGRKLGSRNLAHKWFDTLGARDTEAVIKAIAKKAKDGDTHAAALLLSRTWANPQGRPVQFDLPQMETPADLVAAHASLVEAVADGDLTPDEGEAVSLLLERQRLAIETADHEQRLQAIEERHSDKGGNRGPTLEELLS